MVGVVAHQRRHVERGREPRLAVLEQITEALVRLRRGAEARELAHRPELAAIHRRIDTARERMHTRIAEVAVVVDLDRVRRRQRLVLQPRDRREELALPLRRPPVQLLTPRLRRVQRAAVLGRGHGEDCRDGVYGLREGRNRGLGRAGFRRPEPPRWRADRGPERARNRTEDTVRIRGEKREKVASERPSIQGLKLTSRVSFRHRRGALDNPAGPLDGLDLASAAPGSSETELAETGFPHEHAAQGRYPTSANGVPHQGDLGQFFSVLEGISPQVCAHESRCLLCAHSPLYARD